MSCRNSTATAAEDQGEDNDLQKALNYMEKELNELYVLVVFRNHTPLSQGFPVLRPRWYVSSRNLCDIDIGCNFNEICD